MNYPIVLSTDIILFSHKDEGYIFKDPDGVELSTGSCCVYRKEIRTESGKHQTTEMYGICTGTSCDYIYMEPVHSCIPPRQERILYITDIITAEELVRVVPEDDPIHDRIKDAERKAEAKLAEGYRVKVTRLGTEDDPKYSAESEEYPRCLGAGMTEVEAELTLRLSVQRFLLQSMYWEHRKIHRKILDMRNSRAFVRKGRCSGIFF